MSDFLTELRLSMGFGLPRKVTKPRGDFDRRMEAHWLDHARRCNRPAYREYRGFSPDRWGNTGRASTCGRERPYGWSRAFWSPVWRAMKAAWWSGWNDATGATYETTEGGRSANVIVMGLTA